MTEQEMRVAIAEACGWKRHKTQFGYEWEDPEGRRGFVRRHDDRGGDYLVSAPDYLNDLNAMHESEKEVNIADYVRALRVVVKTADEPDEDIEDDWLLLNATAKQRAEAFCHTLSPERFKE